MEKTVKIGGRDITIRALTWREKKQLKDEGYNISNMDPYADNDKLVERVIGLSAGIADLSFLEDLPVYEVYGLFRKIVKTSAVGEDEAKNSGGPQL